MEMFVEVQRTANCVGREFYCGIAATGRVCTAHVDGCGACLRGSVTDQLPASDRLAARLCRTMVRPPGGATCTPPSRSRIVDPSIGRERRLPKSAFFR